MERPAKKRSAYLKGLFSYQWILSNLVFFLFVAFLMVIYIYNGHEADKVIRDTNTTMKDIKDLKYEYKTLKSEEISRSRRAQVELDAAKLGLEFAVQPVHINADGNK